MATKAAPAVQPASEQQADREEIDRQNREQVLAIFRRWGYLQASLDPLGQYLPPEPFPAPVPEGELAAEARRYYCGTIAVEFAHILNPEQRQWIEEQMEQKAPKQN